MFWTVVVEKTLESPLDCKEIKPINPKGNQSWIFIGRADAEAETPILWPPDGKNWLIRKDPDAGKDCNVGGEGDNKGWDGWMASPTRWTWVWASSRNWWGQGSLACCSPWAHKELDTTEWLKWTKNFPSRNSSIQSQCHLFPGLVPPPILVALWALYCAFIQAKDMFVESSEWLSKAPLTV